MLLGHFLHLISDTIPAPRAPEELKPGNIVVAVADMQQLKETGLPTEIRFGIVCDDGDVICQFCESEGEVIPEHPQFSIKKLSLDDFTEKSMLVYVIPFECQLGSDIVIMSAKMHIGLTYYELRSYPGDDFVAECLSGLSAEELMQKTPIAGQHWWTPLHMTLRQGLKWLGVDVPSDWLPEAADVQVFDQTHHGIAIEGNQVIHFSTRRVPDGSNRIKADSLKEFRSIGDDTHGGSPVKYKEETTEQRLSSRNRAVWIFCHSGRWERYNLMDNNCEHFSRYCRVGKKESRQVIAAVMEALGALITILPRSLPFQPLIIALGLLMKNGARVLGRPEAARDSLAESLFIIE